MRRRQSRLYLHLLPPDHVLLKLDFRNAFNTVKRDKILPAVKDMVTEIFPLMFASYYAPSTLFFQDTTMLSAEGVQQGDPFGPLLVCLMIHPLVLQLQSELHLLYLDDGTLGGPEEEVLQDFDHIAIPRILYLLRTAPCFRFPLLKSFDLELCSCLSAILNVDLVDDSAWTQATLLDWEVLGSATQHSLCRLPSWLLLLVA